MKKLLFVSLAFLFCLSVSAQSPAGGGFQAGKMPNMPNLGHLTGKLVDNAGKPIEGASVLILQAKFDTTTKKSKDVLVKGLTTDSKGEFNAEDLPLMGVKVEISATGFKVIKQPVQFLDPSKMPKAGQGAPSGGGMPSFPSSFDKDIGKLEMTADAAQLQGVTVTSTTPTLKMDIDKKVFNVEKNIVSAGGTAVDVMRNVPSLQVDIDGNVKMRNAAPQIYVDGKPTTLSLDQIPADAIQSVEVITNPSAKFDASGGTAGILNIVLKKNKKTGYNGNIMMGVDSRGGGNVGGNFNIRQGKINLSASVMTNMRKDKATGTIDRLNLGDSQTHVYQNSVNNTNGKFMFGRLGLDYFVTNKTTLSISGIKVHGEFEPNSTTDIYNDSLFSNGDLKSSAYSQRFSNSNRTFNATGLQAGMVHNFARDGQQWTADLNYFGGKNTGDALYTTNYYTGSTVSGTQLQRVISNGNNEFLTLQTDYTQPIGKSTKLETGLRAQLRQLTNDNETYIGPTEAQFTKVSTGSVNYKNHDNVYAGYVTVKSSIKNFGYELGLRAESSDYKGELTNTGETFSNKYPISLFPSVFLSQKLKGNQELQASLTRRVNRPNFFQFIPYTDYTDSLNITRGNPGLAPEFTNSYEVSYGKTFKNNNNILASVYYKHTTDMITRYLQQDINAITGKEELINTYINANSSYAYGAEFTSVNRITKWWDATTNVNIYNSKINTENISNATVQDAMWSWFGKLNNNFKLPKNFAIQLSADYQSKTNLPVNNSSGQPGPPMMQAQSSSQGYIRAFWGTDIAVRKSFLKNNAATVSVSMNDIFRTRKQDQYSYSNYFEQNYYRLNNPQLVRINFTYRFGKMDMNLFKRTKQSSGAQDATQGMQ
jgi:ferric enterobactin receptor